jgi:hypothetical protein
MRQPSLWLISTTRLNVGLRLNLLLKKMIELAVAAGWDRQQVAFATMYLAAEAAKAGEAAQPIQ